MEKIKSGGLPELITEQEVAELFRCSVDTIRRERKRGHIGHTCVGARIFYTEDQLVNYLDFKKVEPCQENVQIGQDKSVTTGSRYDRTAQFGAALGLTHTLDRHAAHHLAQLTFGKPSKSS